LLAQSGDRVQESESKTEPELTGETAPFDTNETVSQEKDPETEVSTTADEGGQLPAEETSPPSMGRKGRTLFGNLKKPNKDA
jgi:hypothetical protein